MTTTRSTDEPVRPPHEHGTCDQCPACMIQGVYCHETGCPNTPVGKCDQCGDEITISGNNWKNRDSAWTGSSFCSQDCAEQGLSPDSGESA